MYKWLNTVLCIFAVTPHAGVRIEIWYDLIQYAIENVTPHAGVRIEIILIRSLSILIKSPPMRGCELKSGR